MFMKERHNKIIETLRKEGRVYVKDLSKQFQISEVAVRKDLQKLEDEGYLTRTHGGAILKRKTAPATNFHMRFTKDVELKETIVKKAFDCIEDGDQIFLDISTTNFILAQKIADSQKNITLITNMSEVGPLFADNLHCTVICIGGVYSKTLGGVVGAAANENISLYRVNKAFIGSCGINIKENKISNFDVEEGITKKRIMDQSETVYILVTIDKLYADGTYHFAALDDVDFIITNEEPDEEVKKAAKKHRVKIL